MSEGLRYRAADGRRFDYSLLNVGEDHGDRVENLTLISISDWQIALGLSLDRRETYRRDGKRFLPVQIKLRGSARILLWQGEGPDPRAIHEWADDGSFEMHLEWDSNN
ncbi:hypothetical protein [Pseudomonas protegens]|uniref:hypothetical protein n=1 Tax=Pseudomonas protegens TaxID=380021 RepID=UPI000642E788|nr:hypothetical protein [Pseudomonas protegens]